MLSNLIIKKIKEREREKQVPPREYVYVDDMPIIEEKQPQPEETERIV